MEGKQQQGLRSKRNHQRHSFHRLMAGGLATLEHWGLPEQELLPLGLPPQPGAPPPWVPLGLVPPWVLGQSPLEQMTLVRPWPQGSPC